MDSVSGAPSALVKALWAPATWRALAHLVSGGIIGFASGLTLLLLLILTLFGAPTVILPLVGCALILKLGGALTALQRSRHRAFLSLDLPTEPSSVPFTVNPQVLVRRLGERRTWVRFGYHVFAVFFGYGAAWLAVAAWAFGLALIAAPLYLGEGNEFAHPYVLCGFGIALVLAAPWTTRGLAALDALAASRMLGVLRSEEQERRITDLTASRSATVDAADAERRRIERDLHDGAQQRITALAVDLGIARATIPDLSEDADRALARAHEESKQVLAELRDLVRGLHPAILEDRGLDAALSAVAARSPIPVRVKVVMDRRVPRDIEAVAYFVACESLTNVAKHAEATRAAIEVSLEPALLRLHIVDNGSGGADPDRGTGLRGLADRVRSVDGNFRLTSPVGGPTSIEVELPCAS
ncbi:sensor histidine kinase [Glycomyces buryatensis]|nr:histidine kinase [Glycomyces buryatensis]